MKFQDFLPDRIKFYQAWSDSPMDFAKTVWMQPIKNYLKALTEANKKTFCISYTFHMVTGKKQSNRINYLMALTTAETVGRKLTRRPFV